MESPEKQRQGTSFCPVSDPQTSFASIPDFLSEAKQVFRFSPGQSRSSLTLPLFNPPPTTRGQRLPVPVWFQDRLPCPLIL
jgi:hypothetical protein